MLESVLKLRDNFFVSRSTNPNEISTDEFYASLPGGPYSSLKVRRFVDSLGNYLDSRLPSALIAVGSSTYSKKYWEEVRELNKKYTSLKAKEMPRNIDLLVVPKKQTSQVISIIEDFLHIPGMYGASKSGPYGSFLSVKVGNSNLDFSQEHKVDIDLIFGGRFTEKYVCNKSTGGISYTECTPVDFFEDAEKKIEKERRGKLPFAVLKN